MTYIRRLTAAVVVALSMVALAACGANEARSLLSSIESGRVILGTKFDQPGLGVRTPEKTFQGVDTDVSRYVINYIADKKGWAVPEMSWRETPSSQRETPVSYTHLTLPTM